MGEFLENKKYIVYTLIDQPQMSYYIEHPTLAIEESHLELGQLPEVPY